MSFLLSDDLKNTGSAGVQAGMDPKRIS